MTGRPRGAHRATSPSAASSPLWLAAGSLVLGVSTYGYLSVTGRTLGADRMAGVSAIYTLIYTVGPGLFLPLEQELARVLPGRRKGDGADPVGTVVGLSALLGLVVGVLVLALLPVTYGRIYDSHSLLVASLVLSIPGFALSFIARGVFAGQGRWRRYGVQLGVEGTTRLVGCVALVLAGVHDPGPYGLLLGLAPLVSAVATWMPRPPEDRAGARDYRRVLGALTALMVGSIAALVVVNVGPVAVKVLATTAQHGDASRFLAALVVVRVPLFLFQSVQASLLPNLAAHASADRMSELWRLAVITVGALLAVGAASALLALAAGPEAIRLLFGPSYRIGRDDLALLALGGAFWASAVIVGQTLLALHRHVASAVGWLVAVASVFALLVGFHGLITRAVAAYTGGAGVALIAQVAVLVALVQRGSVNATPLAAPALEVVP